MTGRAVAAADGVLGITTGGAARSGGGRTELHADGGSGLCSRMYRFSRLICSESNRLVVSTPLARSNNSRNRLLSASSDSDVCVEAEGRLRMTGGAAGVVSAAGTDVSAPAKGVGEAMREVQLLQYSGGVGYGAVTETVVPV